MLFCFSEGPFLVLNILALYHTKMTADTAVLVVVCCSVSLCFVFPGELALHSASVTACSFSPDGNLLASASDDETVRVWEVGALKCISTITKHTDR